MKDAGSDAGGSGWKLRLLRACLALLGITAFAVFAITLEKEAGIPFKTTFRIACAMACLILIAKIGSDHPGERWPWIALLLAFLFNAGLFFSPLVNLPASKGDLLFFGVPDAAIVLAVRTAFYPVTDDHQRAVRQQMVLGIVLALAFCAIVLSMIFIPPHATH